MKQNPQFPVGSVTFTEEILNGKLYFCAVKIYLKNFEEKKPITYFWWLTLDIISKFEDTTLIVAR